MSDFYQPPESEVIQKEGDLSEVYFNAFVGSNTDFYKSAFRKFNDGKEFLGVNPVCILFPIYWLIYRKLYLIALLLFLITDFTPYILVRFTTVGEELASIVVVGLIIAINFSLFLSANYMYLKKYEKVERSLRGRDLSQDAIVERIRMKGGTNPIGVLALLGFYILSYFAS